MQLRNFQTVSVPSMSVEIVLTNNMLLLLNCSPWKRSAHIFHFVYHVEFHVSQKIEIHFDKRKLIISKHTFLRGIKCINLYRCIIQSDNKFKIFKIRNLKKKMSFIHWIGVQKNKWYCTTNFKRFCCFGRVVFIRFGHWLDKISSQSVRCRFYFAKAIHFIISKLTV